MKNISMQINMTLNYYEQYLKEKIYNKSYIKADSTVAWRTANLMSILIFKRARNYSKLTLIILHNLLVGINPVWIIIFSFFN